MTLETMKLVIELGELGEPGVDVNAVDPDGRTALDVARRLEYETVVAYLVEHGARAGTSDNA